MYTHPYAYRMMYPDVTKYLSCTSVWALTVIQFTQTEHLYEL